MLPRCQTLQTQHDGRETAAELSWGNSKSYLLETLRSALSQFLPSGLFIVAAGFILSLSGWNANWMVMAYVFVAIGLVLVKTLVKMVSSSDLRDLYVASVFILLSIPLLQAPFIRMDPYGFFMIGGLANTPLPYLLALLANLVVALVTGLMFNVLWRWEYSRHSQDMWTARRAALVVLPPLLFVFGWNLAVSSIGVLVYLLSVLPVMAGVFSALAVLQERNTTLLDQNLRYILWAVAVLAVVLIALNGAAIVVVNLLPGVIVLPDGGLFGSWNIDYSALEYPRDDLGSRLQLGVLWTSFATLAYVVITVAGSLAVYIYSHEKGASPGPAIAIPISLALLIGVCGLALAASSSMRAQPADFDATVEDVWLVPSRVAAGDSAEIKVRFRNRSSFSGPHGGDAGFDVSIVVESPAGSAFRHEVDNQSFSYNQKWVFTAEHNFDQAGTYTITAEIYDISGREKGWNASHRFDIRSETFTIVMPKGDQ